MTRERFKEINKRPLELQSVSKYVVKCTCLMYGSTLTSRWVPQTMHMPDGLDSLGKQLPRVYMYRVLRCNVKDNVNTTTPYINKAQVTVLSEAGAGVDAHHAIEQVSATEAVEATMNAVKAIIVRWWVMHESQQLCKNK